MFEVYFADMCVEFFLSYNDDGWTSVSSLHRHCKDPLHHLWKFYDKKNLLCLFTTVVETFCNISKFVSNAAKMNMTLLEQSNRIKDTKNLLNMHSFVIKTISKYIKPKCENTQKYNCKSLHHLKWIEMIKVTG